MKKNILLVFCLLLAYPVFNGHGLAKKTSLSSGSNTLIAQPDRIPGRWEIAKQPFPPLEMVNSTVKDKKPVYGLYSWAYEYGVFRKGIKDVGWKTVRIAGPIDDNAMKMFAEDPVEIIYTIEGKNRSEFGSDLEFIRYYEKNIRDTLTRYGPGGTFFKNNPRLPNRPLQHVEIWNEPNFHYLMPNGGEPERESLYAKLLETAFNSVKSRWPEVTVIGFAAGGADAGDLRFIEHVHDTNKNIALRYDVLSTHPYVAPNPPEVDCVRQWGKYSIARSLSSIRSNLKKENSAARGIWYTEIGWRIGRNEGGKYDAPPDDMVSQRLQAAYTCRAYALALRLGVGRVCSMFVSDTDGFNGGFFNDDSSYRESARAVKNMISLLPDPRIAKIVHDGENGLFAYHVKPDRNSKKNKDIIMAWNVSGQKKININFPGASATITDMLGNTITAGVVNNSLAITVGPCPVYIRAR